MSVRMLAYFRTNELRVINPWFEADAEGWSIKIVFGSTSARLLVGVTTTITVASDITSSSVKSDHECKRRNADLATPRLPAVQLTREVPGIVEADLRCRRTRLIREGCPNSARQRFSGSITTS